VRSGFIKGFSGVGIVKFSRRITFLERFPKNASSVFPFGNKLNSTKDANITIGIESRYAVTPVARNRITEK